jgi:rhomboid protease GluP
MNMIALGSIGPEVERFRGLVGTLASFVGIAVVSNAMVLWLMRADVLEENVLIGASGAIMGFIGMIAARFLGNWWLGRKRRDFGRLVNLAILLALQAVIDISVPQISGTAHACGFLTGLALGGLLYRADAAEAPR